MSAPAIETARQRHAAACLRFVQGDAADPGVLASAGGPFDVVLLVNVVTHLTDVQAALERLHAVVHPRTRVFIYSYSRLWQPLLRLAEIVGLKYRQPPESWLPPEEIENMLALADFELVRRDAQLVCPVHVPLVAELSNRYLGRLPIADQLSLMFGIVARPSPARTASPRNPRAVGQRGDPLPQRGRPHRPARGLRCRRWRPGASSCSSRATPATTPRR